MQKLALVIAAAFALTPTNTVATTAEKTPTFGAWKTNISYAAETKRPATFAAWVDLPGFEHVVGGLTPKLAIFCSATPFETSYAAVLSRFPDTNRPEQFRGANTTNIGWAANGNEPIQMTVTATEAFGKLLMIEFDKNSKPLMDVIQLLETSNELFVQTESGTYDKVDLNGARQAMEWLHTNCKK